MKRSGSLYFDAQDSSLVSARVALLRKYFEPGPPPAALSAPLGLGDRNGRNAAERDEQLDVDAGFERLLAEAPSEKFAAAPHYFLEKRQSRWVFARESVRSLL